MSTNERLEGLESRISTLEEIVQSLHLDAAASEVRKTKPRRKRRTMSESQKLDFRARMLEGRAAAAKDEKDAKEFAQKAAEARQKAESARKAEEEAVAS